MTRLPWRCDGCPATVIGTPLALLLGGWFLAVPAAASVSISIRSGITSVESRGFYGPIADLTDTRPGAQAGDLTVVIDWGDGTPRMIGQISGPPFVVTQGHIYGDEGTFIIGVGAVDNVDSSPASDAKTCTVNDADDMTPLPITFSATQGKTFTGTVASFQDVISTTLLSDFAATIDWGDGSTSDGQAGGASGTWSVSGSHMYTVTGTLPVTVTLIDAPDPVQHQAFSTAIVQPAGGNCTAGATTLCLGDSRFAVLATWAAANQTGPGMAVPVTADTGYFWFFSPGNVEEMIKVLNGCGVNQHYWVFAGGLTNVAVTTVVTDTTTGSSKIYVNPQNTPFQPIQDSGALAVCP